MINVNLLQKIVSNAYFRKTIIQILTMLHTGQKAATKPNPTQHNLVYGESRFPIPVFFLWRYQWSVTLKYEKKDFCFHKKELGV